MTLTLDRAMALVQAALQQGREQGLALAVAVVDRGGRLLCAARSELAGFVQLDAATRKAVAAVNFGAPTEAVSAMVKDDPLLFAAVGSMADIMLLPGGSPVLADGLAIGAIGVAGGHYSQDQAVADFAAGAL